MAKWVPIQAREDFLGSGGPAEGAKRPSFGAALTVILLPVALMLARTVVEMTGGEESPIGAAIVFVGTPLIALSITTVVAMFVLGFLLSKTRDEVSRLVGSSFGPIAGILLIVGAGGGFKQTLVDSGIADVIAKGLVEFVGDDNEFAARPPSHHPDTTPLGLGRDLFAGFRAGVSGAEEGACSWGPPERSCTQPLKEEAFA